MDIIHGVNDRPEDLPPLPRHAGSGLRDRLAVMPAVVVTGPRQAGKSTLVRDLTPGRRTYLTLDDVGVRELAQTDPDAILGGGGSAVTIDEIQREPDLLLAVKRDVDRKRKPGRFLLTGSANLRLMNRVSESLAGRASYVTLWPMTRREQAGLGTVGVWEALCAAPEVDWPELLSAAEPGAVDWKVLARRGGFPTPALQLRTAKERAVWFDGYIRTYLERDLQDLASITSLVDFRRLMRAAALRLGQMLNQTELGRDVGLPQPTVHRWLNLLEASYLLVRLPAYAVNRTKRLIKTPKLFWGDTGVALHLAGGGEPGGAHLENLILHDLLAWRDGRLDPAEVCYWRTTTNEEIDFVVEVGERLLPIEVKSKGRPRLQDAKGLLSFRREYPERSLPGLLLHTGKSVEWLAPGILAAPWWAVV